MKLIDVTNSYVDVVTNQLNSTDAHHVRVYSLGNTTVIFTKATNHDEILLTNRSRNIQESEIDFVLDQLVHLTQAEVKPIISDKLAEISITHNNKVNS
ncbi:DUF1827 family protein [Loigolactobacillus iwatensis]|uniref:DUF1827 family protein n=1 Tax=Loigolactobacillus iwatensis TaxID=1267156 RepID=UPI000F7F0580|nr:DUF1827 family protein [Loigolactobacillus iwatensis]